MDRLSLESYLVLVQKDITAQLAHMPVNVSRRTSEYMVKGGVITERCYGAFVYDLGRRDNRYHPGTDTVVYSKDRNLGAVGLRSLKRSLDEEDDDRAQAKESSLRKNESSRTFNSVRAIDKPEIALLEDLVAQASEEEERRKRAPTKAKGWQLLLTCRRLPPASTQHLT